MFLHDESKCTHQRGRLGYSRIRAVWIVCTDVYICIQRVVDRIHTPHVIWTYSIIHYEVIVFLTCVYIIITLFPLAQ